MKQQLTLIAYTGNLLYNGNIIHIGMLSDSVAENSHCSWSLTVHTHKHKNGPLFQLIAPKRLLCLTDLSGALYGHSSPHPVLSTAGSRPRYGRWDPQRDVGLAILRVIAPNI